MEALRRFILKQPSVTAAADNWQRNGPKKWQDDGKSSIFQKGTAYFIKRDKVFILPVGTAITSPSGVKCVVSRVE